MLALVFFAFSSAHAQQGGTVSGVVISSYDGLPLPAVTVTVRGTTLATQTDANGRYQLENVPPGDQVFRFSKSGYASAMVTDVRVLLGQTTTVNGNLRPEFYEMEEYEVTAEEFTEQTQEIMFERQQASGMMDAVGSDTLKNLAVSDAAGALSKVTGASIADGKYAVIRGLADRYTFTTLNQMELPSADPDRKAFQLDLMPAKFIDKVDVRKTFTPDMGGGFAGGSIDIVTKSYPDDFLFEFRAETAYNTQSSLRDDFAASDRSSTDWLGFDDGLRALPPEAAATSPAGTSTDLPPNVKSSFKSSQFAPVPIDSPLDAGFSLLLGDTYKVFGKRLGFLAGFNYKNEYRYYDNGIVRRFSTSSDADIDKTDVRGVIDYQWGALANLSLELAENHDLKFNFLYIQSAQDEARRLQGEDVNAGATAEDGSYVDQSILHWTERSLTYFQLAGEHEFPELNGIRLDWGAATSTTTQDEPDYRIFQFKAEPSIPRFSQSSIAQPARPTRYWRELQEDNVNLRADLTIPVPSYNSKENFLRAGAALSESQRDYNQRGFEYRFRTSPPRHPFEQEGDPNDVVTDANLPFVNLRNFPVNLTYSGEQKINAGYLMADWAALEWLRLIGGARYETTDLSITAENLTNPGNSPDPGHIRQDDLLPSLAAIIQIRKNLDLRAAWSRTVVRPTYREIAEVAVYDVTQNRVFTGNSDLTLSTSENFDLRISWYPRPGEILSAGVFAKKIGQPIELSDISTDKSQISYENFEKADVYGVEGELRVGLDRIWEPLDGFTLGFNGAVIESEVPLTGDQRGSRMDNFGESSTSRPLYNQPTYILNGDLTWEIEATRTTITLSGGVVGERLVLVGLAAPDEFEQPAPELNLFIRQRLGKHWDVRFTAKNLLDPRYEVAQTWPDGRKTVLQSYTKGMTFGLSVGCEF